MKRRLLVVAMMLVSAGVVLVGSSASAKSGDEDTFRASLNGFNEVVGGPGPDSTGSVSTAARGTFRAQLLSGPPRLRFTLTYSGIEGGTVTQAHPHFAQRHVGGGVFGFLCGGPKPACPTPSGTVQATWSAADIIGPGAQGVGPGSFQEFVRALRAGAVYVNVHSTNFPEGEIRGQVGGNDEDEDEEEDDD